MNLVEQVEKKYSEARAGSIPDFRSGDTVAVHVRITEGAKTRLQIFQGICIAKKESGTLNGHFRVRKISSGQGVERVFPYHCPSVEKVEVVGRGKSKRAKHYYLRDRSGKSARIATDYSRENKAAKAKSSK